MGTCVTYDYFYVYTCYCTLDVEDGDEGIGDNDVEFDDGS